MTLKEKYWQTGNIFEFNTGKKRFVWNDGVIDLSGYSSKALFNDELVNTDSSIGEHVIRIYSPNVEACYFAELTTTKPERILWQKSDYIFSMKEIKEKLNIPDDEELIIIGDNRR